MHTKGLAPYEETRTQEGVGKSYATNPFEAGPGPQSHGACFQTLVVALCIVHAILASRSLTGNVVHASWPRLSLNYYTTNNAPVIPELGC